MTCRSVRAVRTAPMSLIGDLETRDVLGQPIDPGYDPFLVLGHHGPQRFAPGNQGMPFSDHPHRGFETVTFILEGSLVHTDSKGNRCKIDRGGVQWMTAGSGVVHNEQVPPEFFRDGGLLEVIQIWVNLPARLKMTSPGYTGVQAEGIPELPVGIGTSLHLVSGAHRDLVGPISSLTDVFMGWVDLRADSKAELPAPRGRSVLLYVVRGEVDVGGRRAKGGDLVRFADDGAKVAIATISEAVVLFGHAEPTGEPIVARGPFVMNSQAEIAQAYADFRAGLFA